MSAPTATAPNPIPWAYRFLLTTLEPVFAATGAVLAFRDPAKYLATMTRDAASFAAGSDFLYTQLGGGWLYFAFVEAVVLRLYPADTRLWRLLCIGMLLSDAAYVHSCAQALGGWAAWADVTQWTGDDWAVFLATAPPLAARAAFVLGVGVGGQAKAKKN